MGSKAALIREASAKDKGWRYSPWKLRLRRHPDRFRWRWILRVLSPVRAIVLTNPFLDQELLDAIRQVPVSCSSVGSSKPVGMQIVVSMPRHFPELNEVLF
jgi:hypothetical protein